MGEVTGIQWCDHTFNPWTGCNKVPENRLCDNCYAERDSRRYGYSDTGKKGFRLWGPPETTQRLARVESYWSQPIRWNAKAEKAGKRARVFCASQADVFEANPDPVVTEGRARLWKTIAATPWLDWLLLTKRPQNVMGMVPPEWHNHWDAVFPTNVWIGTSVGTKAIAIQNIPMLLEIPAAVRFLSAEPLLEPTPNQGVQCLNGAGCWHHGTRKPPPSARGPVGELLIRAKGKT